MTLTSVNRLADYALLAKDACWSRWSGSGAVKQRTQSLVSERLGRMRGIPQKMGQLLSLCETDSGIASPFAKLQEAAEPLPWSELKPVVEAEWGVSIDSVAIEVDSHGKAASLGQVHRMRLRDGRTVAVKVQFPGIRESLEADLSMLGWLTTPIGGLNRGFDLAGYRQTLRTSLEQELDYQGEANRQQRFASAWRCDQALLTPEVHADLCTKRVLTTSWEDGDRLEQVLTHWSATNKQRLAELLVKIFLESLLRKRIVHADWHPGNFRFRQESFGPQVVLYDYGCLWEPTCAERDALIELMRIPAGVESAWQAFLALGFAPAALAPLKAKLPKLCDALFAPLSSREPFDPLKWDLGLRVSAVLGEDRWNFRMAAPPTLLFLMRSWHGLLTFLTQLRSPTPWLPVFEAAVEPEFLNNRKIPQTSHPASLAGATQALESRQLKIRVSEAGQMRVQISQPAGTLERLAELLDEQLLLRIAEQGVDLAAITQSAQARNYAAGPLFECSIGAKQIAVWLE